MDIHITSAALCCSHPRQEMRASGIKPSNYTLSILVKLFSVRSFSLVCGCRCVNCKGKSAWNIMKYMTSDAIYIYYIYISYVYWGKHYGFQMFRAFCPLTILKRLKYPCIMSLKIKRSHFQRLQLQRLWPNHSNSQFSACRLIYHNLSVSQGLGLNYWRVFFWGTVVPRELWKPSDTVSKSQLCADVFSQVRRYVPDVLSSTSQVISKRARYTVSPHR